MLKWFRNPEPACAHKRVIISGDGYGRCIACLSNFYPCEVQPLCGETL